MKAKWTATIAAVVMASVVLFAGAVWAGDAPTDVQTPPVGVESEAFFAGGGSVYELLFPDFSELNAALPGVQFTGDFKFGEQMAFIVNGGGGFGASDLRFGGRGAHGSWSAPVSSKQFDRAELRLDYGGFFCEVLLNQQGRLPFFIGLLLGNLDLKLRLSRTSPGDFSDVVAEPFLAELDRSYFVLEPYVSTEFHVLDFMGIKLELGYLMAFSTREWRTPFKEKINNGPLKTLFTPVLGMTLVFGG